MTLCDYTCMIIIIIIIMGFEFYIICMHFKRIICRF